MNGFFLSFFLTILQLFYFLASYPFSEGRCISTENVRLEYSAATYYHSTWQPPSLACAACIPIGMRDGSLACEVVRTQESPPPYEAELVAESA